MSISVGSLQVEDRRLDHLHRPSSHVWKPLWPAGLPAWRTAAHLAQCSFADESPPWWSITLSGQQFVPPPPENRTRQTFQTSGTMGHYQSGDHNTSALKNNKSSGSRSETLSKGPFQQRRADAEGGGWQVEVCSSQSSREGSPLLAWKLRLRRCFQLGRQKKKVSIAHMGTLAK